MAILAISGQRAIVNISNKGKKAIIVTVRRNRDHIVTVAGIDIVAAIVIVRVLVIAILLECWSKYNKRHVRVQAGEYSVSSHCTGASTTTYNIIVWKGNYAYPS